MLATAIQAKESYMRLHLSIQRLYPEAIAITGIAIVALAPPEEKNKEGMSVRQLGIAVGFAGTAMIAASQGCLYFAERRVQWLSLAAGACFIGSLALPTHKNSRSSVFAPWWTDKDSTEGVKITLRDVRDIAVELKKKVVGQDHVIDEIEAPLKGGLIGLKIRQNKPTGFFFMGPTGTGKTELTKQIAALTKRPKFIRYDMGEFSEPHSVSKLLGSPPSYVGYGQTDTLTDKLQRQPNAVLLFDEIEKAHPQVVRILLGLLDEGRLTNGKGRIVHAPNVIIVFTSNVGADLWMHRQPDGSNDETIVQAVKRAAKDHPHFPPEFHGRMTSTCVFHPLTDATKKQIIELKLKDFVEARKTDKRWPLDLSVTPEVIRHLQSGQLGVEGGARGLERYLGQEVVSLIVNEIVHERLAKNDKAELRLINGQLEVVKVNA